MRTAEELRELGVEADVSGAIAPDLDSYDLVHLFNTLLIEPTYRHALRARGLGIPIVLTPIYWEPIEPRLLASDPGEHELLLRRERAMQATTMALASVLVPNSSGEVELIGARFPGLSARVHVVHNGVDRRYGEGDGARFAAEHGVPERGFVLVAARKEERKNQLRVVEACAELGLPLVLAGAEYDDRKPYVDECRARADERGAHVVFLPQLEPAGLADAYAAARVHALPSYWETVGLSTLEAAVAGCNVVVARNSGTRDYLGDDAWYCDHESGESIRDAIAAAFEAPLRDDVGRRVAERFTWRRAAEETVVAYGLAMDARRDAERPLPLDTYVDHLEELIQLQLEAIAYRDGDHARLREVVGEQQRQLEEIHGQADRLQGDADRLQGRVDELHDRAVRAEGERDAALGELARIQATKLFRYAAPFRRAYARVSRRRGS